MMAGRDCVGVAETGSGKTLSFFLPAMMRRCAKEGVATGGKSKLQGPHRAHPCADARAGDAVG